MPVWKIKLKINKTVKNIENNIVDVIAEKSAGGSWARAIIGPGRNWVCHKKNLNGKRPLALIKYSK